MYLQVVLRVPVRVEDDTGISCSQVDTESSGSRTQQKDEAVRVWSGEPVDGGLPQVTTNSAVYTFIRVSGQSGRTRVNYCQEHQAAAIPAHSASILCLLQGNFIFIYFIYI